MQAFLILILWNKKSLCRSPVVHLMVTEGLPALFGRFDEVPHARVEVGGKPIEWKPSHIQ
jgi:hypothetical protein